MKNKLIISFIFSLSLMGMESAFDNFFSEDQVSFPCSYIYPNEGNPIRLVQAIEDVSEIRIDKDYLGVGTERCFVALALLKSLRGYFVDRDIGVVIYNQINIALLAISEDIEDYLYLRLDAGFSEWTSRSHHNEFRYNHMLSNEKLWEWWNRRVQDVDNFGDDGGGGIAADEILKRMHEGNPKAFSNANYLFDEDLFIHLQKLSKGNKIFSFHLDLGDLNDINKFILETSHLRPNIGFFDISNAWDYKYMTSKQVNRLKSIFIDNGICTLRESGFLITALESARDENDCWAYIFVPVVDEDTALLDQIYSSLHEEGFEVPYFRSNIFPLSDQLINYGIIKFFNNSEKLFCLPVISPYFNVFIYPKIKFC